MPDACGGALGDETCALGGVIRDRPWTTLMVTATPLRSLGPEVSPALLVGLDLLPDEDDSVGKFGVSLVVSAA